MGLDLELTELLEISIFSALNINKVALSKLFGLSIFFFYSLWFSIGTDLFAMMFYSSGLEDGDFRERAFLLTIV